MLVDIEGQFKDIRNSYKEQLKLAKKKLKVKQIENFQGHSLLEA